MCCYDIVVVGIIVGLIRVRNKEVLEVELFLTIRKSIQLSNQKYCFSNVHVKRHRL